MGKHTSTYRGKPVRLYLRDGSHLDGRFVIRRKNGIIELDTGKVSKRLVLRLVVLRGGKSRPGESSPSREP